MAIETIRRRNLSPNRNIAFAILGLYRANTTDELLSAAAIANTYRKHPDVVATFAERWKGLLRERQTVTALRFEAAFKQGLTSDGY